jgi:flavodoxin short chain
MEAAMKTLLVVYWSGTGNTKAMAQAVAQGARDTGSEAIVKDVNEAGLELVRSADALALGCPSMGVEVLEEDLMEPFVAALDKEIMDGRKLGLFGSYDWGDGEWMRNWVDRMRGLGADVVGDGLITQLEPDPQALEACNALGAKLVA